MKQLVRTLAPIRTTYQGTVPIHFSRDSLGSDAVRYWGPLLAFHEDGGRKLLRNVANDLQRTRLQDPARRNLNVHFCESLKYQLRSKVLSTF